MKATTNGPALIRNIRRRPGMYVGDVDRAGRVAERLLRYGAAMHARGECARIALRTEGDAVEVLFEGLALTPSPGATMATALAAPPVASDVHLGDDGWSMVCLLVALSQEVSVTSTDRDHAVTAHWRHGVMSASPRVEAPASIAQLGVSVRYRLEHVHLADGTDLTTLVRSMSELTALTPTLRVDYALVGVAREPHGLAGRVARAAAVATDEVVIARGLRDGVVVDAALAWPAWDGRPRVEGFVDTREVRHGTHVQGLRDGATIGLALPRSIANRHLIAAVRVVLDDSRLTSFIAGRATRLSSPRVRPAVAAVVAEAIAAWCIAHPAAAAALRTRLGPS